MAAFPFTDDHFFATLIDLNASLRKKEFSAVELTKAFTNRLETIGRRYNALVTPITEDAIRRAKLVDEEMKRDRLRGPLQGIPFGAKDLLAYPGHPTTWGAKPYAGRVLNETATVLKKLEAAGGVLIGKLAMVELAGGGGYRFPSASLTGPGLNPWDRTRWAGGSSSGSAAAVAAGLVPYSLGSETNGSILFPAAYCGVTGLRPTYGLVSRHGAMALSWTMDKIGIFARDTEDCGHILQHIAGADAADPGSAGKSFYYMPEYARALKDLKIGYNAEDKDLADPAAVSAFESAYAIIGEFGMGRMPAKLPDFPYGALGSTIVSAEAASIFEPLISSGDINLLADMKQAEGLKAGLEIPAKDYLRAMRIRSLVKQAFQQIFAEVDVLIAPTRYVIAPKASEPLVPNSPGNKGMSALITAGNLAGLPALSLPCGFADGMPVAIQLVGPAYSENTLLAIGREFQARTDWHKRRPKV